MKKSALPYAAFAACGVIWGSTFLVIRVGNDSLAPLWACTLRLALAGVILNIILLLTGQNWPQGPALRAAAWFGFWEFGVGMTLLYWGERVVPSGLAAVLYAICPVVAMFEARAIGLEQLNLQRVGAALLAFAGVAVVFWHEILHGGSPLGLLAVFLAAIAAPIAGLVLQKGPRPGAIATNAVGVLVGMVMSLLGSLLLGETRIVPTTASQILPVVYLAVLGSAGAFVIFAWLIQHWKVTTVSFLGVVIPVIAVIVGTFFRHETLAPGSIVGACVVFVGVTIALRSETRAAPVIPTEGPT